MDTTGNFIDEKSLLSAVSSGTGGGGISGGGGGGVGGGEGGGGGGGGCSSSTVVVGGAATTTGTSTLSSMSVELCLVCGDRASGRHYGAISCEGCKGFFKRSIRKQLGYQCRGTMNCEVTKHHRNRCQFCRLQKCLASGMRSDSVQHERKPIIDKKELHTSISGSSGGGTSSGVIYHHRNKTSSYGQQNAGTSGSSAVGTNAAETLSTVFPVGFNFADLTQTLNKRALLVSAPYQQQIGGQIDNFSCSPSTQTNDDDSMDNTGMGATGQSQGALGGGGTATGGITSNLSGQDHGSNSATSASVTAAAASLIQSSIEKHIIMQSLDLIAGVQQQYDPSSIIPNNNNNNNNNNNTIVKDEVIIDDNQRKLINDFDEDHHHHHHHHHHHPHHSHSGGDRISVDLPILPEMNVNFNLQIPTLVPSYLNLHYVCECGSRILFLSVYWIKKIHAFQQLPEDIQVRLLRRHWVQLFAIGLSQCSRMLSMSTIMTTLISNIIQISEIEKVTASKIRKLCEHTCQLHQFVETMHSMDLTEHEYAYMRLLMVFSPDDFNVKNQKKFTTIEKLQDYALISFRNHLIESSNHSEPNERCNKILLRLMQLTALESDIIEELFFSSLIGQVQIENMIPYILKLGGGGV